VLNRTSDATVALQQVQYSSSVEIRPEWAVKEQISYPALAKLSCSVGEPEEVLAAGELEYYDRLYDRISARNEVKLQKSSRVFRSVTTSDDPVIRRLAAEGGARVFVTDAILTALMCVKSSVYSWDIVITRAGEHSGVLQSAEMHALTSTERSSS